MTITREGSPPKKGTPHAKRRGQHKRVLAWRKTYHASSNSWSEWEEHTSLSWSQSVNVIKMKRGGQVVIYPNFQNGPDREHLESELLNCGLFRQFKIQTNDEPRCHFLLHDEASENFEDAQPGYKYGNIALKSRPLSQLAQLEKFSKRMAKVCKVSQWTIGVNPVLYRDGRDHIGYHKDCAQGEELVVSAIISSPNETRAVHIRTYKNGTPSDGDEEIKLDMEAGDAYSMDALMQQSYWHCVPEQKSTIGERAPRLAIVFRTGKKRRLKSDSGRICEDVSPRVPIQYNIGNIAELEEGRIYSRVEMRDMGAHNSVQSGIGGNQEDGCHAIVVSGSRGEGIGEGDLECLWYQVEKGNGAYSILTNLSKLLPIRVFRSMSYQSPYRALVKEKTKSTQYRYDGLYLVSNYDVSGTTHVAYQFYLMRGDSHHNCVPTDRFEEHCEELNTLLPQKDRDFLLWWDSTGRPEMQSSREVLYTREEFRSGRTSRKKRDKCPSPRCEQLVETYLEKGLDACIAMYQKLFPDTPEDKEKLRLADMCSLNEMKKKCKEELATLKRFVSVAQARNNRDTVDAVTP